jgi:hypothetical protein
LNVTFLDQVSKLTNQFCAFASKGCESPVLICEISAGSDVTGKLGVVGRGAPDIVLQACNADSISNATSLHSSHILRVFMDFFLLNSPMLEHGVRSIF